MKVADIVKFVLENRKNKVCKNWSPYQITQDVGIALKNSTLAFTTDDNGNLNGLVWGTPDYKKKILHIDTILATSKSALPSLMKYFLAIYNGWTLTAERKGKFVTYSTEKLRKIYGK